MERWNGCCFIVCTSTSACVMVTVGRATNRRVTVLISASARALPKSVTVVSSFGMRCYGLSLFVAALSMSATATAPPSALYTKVADLVGMLQPPSPPQYPDSYEVAYTFALPYERKYLPDGLVLPVRVWRDEVSRRVRMDTYDGMNSLITTEKFNLEISPQGDELRCSKFDIDPGEPGLLNTPILPDVSGWEYRGKDTIRGQQAYVWEYSKHHGDKHTVYKFYSAKNGAPLRLHMHGNDAFSGAHFDVYVVDYTHFRPGSQDSSIFAPPKVCKNVEPQPPPISLRSFPARMRALAPAVRHDRDSLYDQFLGARGRVPASAQEYQQRLHIFWKNAELVATHNRAPNRSFTLELNKFADWSQEEFEAVMLPRHSERRGLVSRHKSSAEVPYQRQAPKHRIPGTVDWRGSPANQYVKDQAACGSCWAFAATGVLEAAYYLATGAFNYSVRDLLLLAEEVVTHAGKQKLFSEQQSMDCSWGYGLNKACDGGDYDAAMDYLKKAGGLIEERNYEYLGADGFCGTKNISADSLTPFEGYSYVPPGDDEALMEAVYSRGPVAVSLDASQPSFRFYSGGIMDEPNCMWKSEDLDHAVLLVGYGTCPLTGKDYWLIRNSWSTYWGDEGYVKIARGHHGCGISTDPVYAVFKSEKE